jgi:hypothetical protein
MDHVEQAIVFNNYNAVAVCVALGLDNINYGNA